MLSRTATFAVCSGPRMRARLLAGGGMKGACNRHAAAVQPTVNRRANTVRRRVVAVIAVQPPCMHHSTAEQSPRNRRATAVQVPQLSWEGEDCIRQSLQTIEDRMASAKTEEQHAHALLMVGGGALRSRRCSW